MVASAQAGDGPSRPGRSIVLHVRLLRDWNRGHSKTASRRAPDEDAWTGPRGQQVSDQLAALRTIAKGMEGDLVAVEGNPLDDIAALKHVKAVVHQGRVVVAPK